MVCGTDISLAVYNVEVSDGGKCCKLEAAHARFGLVMFKHCSHVGGVDGHGIMTVIDFHIFIISLLCTLNLTT
jgi:hypothetical protein